MVRSRFLFRWVFFPSPSLSIRAGTGTNFPLSWYLQRSQGPPLPLRKHRGPRLIRPSAAAHPPICRGPPRDRPSAFLDPNIPCLITRKFIRVTLQSHPCDLSAVVRVTFLPTYQPYLNTPSLQYRPYLGPTYPTLPYLLPSYNLNTLPS